MEEKELNAVLMDKLAELSKLEIKKSKVLAVIFQKKMQQILEHKMQSLEANFKEQAEFYGQDLEDYESTYQEIRGRYQVQLSGILNKYNELFINLYLELQEAECNQKIAITNLKKSYDTKQQIPKRTNVELIEEYDRKMNACFQKKVNYDIIIQECQNELEKSIQNMEHQIDTLFEDKLNKISLKEESALAKLIQKIKNMFSGKTKFNTYVIEPIHVELEMMDNKLPELIGRLQEQTILAVAKMKQAKAQTNQIFDNMI